MHDPARKPPHSADRPGSPDQHGSPDLPGSEGGPSVVRRVLLGIGLGPGDPDLLTLKALAALSQADAILVPATEASADGPGRAEQIVSTHLPQAPIVRVRFSMADRSGVTGRRKAAWQSSAQAAADAFAAGATRVAFATVGDPSVYSTFSYLAAEVSALVEGVAIEVIPGITAMQALAAESRTPLVEGTEILALVPATAGLDRVADTVACADTVVVYKGGRQLPQLRERLGDRAAVLGVNLGLPEQHLDDLHELAADHQAPYFSALLIPAHRSSETGGRL